ncbi:P-II family nitrogen regulator [Geomonas sp. Red32]|uniref:P-II family nitrogen regulator n=1 Tax=Geomonas sp. Red32 TaxID=2912856 RepID=UPI00202CAC39|nr:P-II family nitrogen regulator [Geomonas sp. Red32]MCM0084244.1 P-II family nitrogen regulator [Geomonas sp. Red32]
MKLIQAIIGRKDFEEVKAALEAIGVDEIMESDIVSHGSKDRETVSYRGVEGAVNSMRRTKLEVMVAEELVSKVVKTIRTFAGGGLRQDCRIFLLSSVDTYQLSTVLSFNLVERAFAEPCRSAR